MFDIHPLIYNSSETDFITGGLGPAEPSSCIVTEERNGMYELEMDVPIGSLNYDKIKIGRIILAPHFPELNAYADYDDWEPFEIVEIEHTLAKVMHVRAWHVSYRLSKVSVLPFAVEYITPCSPPVIVSYADIFPATHGFTFQTDIYTDIYEYNLDHVTTYRKLFGGEEGSFIDRFGGELEWNRFKVKLLTRRGTDTDVVLKYGQNITGMTRQQTGEEVFMGVAPYWKGDDNGTEVTVTLPEKAYYDSTILSSYYSQTLIIPLDMSRDFESKPTVSELRSAATAWVAEHKYTVMPENIDVSFIHNPENANDKVQTLKLCDTLTVEYPEMGLTYTAKVTKVVFNVLLNRYDEVSISTTPATLNKAIRQVADK